MKNLIFNSNNVVSDGFNSRFRYTFGSSSYTLREGDKIALSSINIPYSWFNISSFNNNNSYQFSFNGTVYTVTMPDGFYTIIDIDNYLQFFCQQNNLYTLTSNGDFNYYFKWSENTTRYAIQWDAFPISLPSGGTNPNSLSMSGNIPLLIMNNNLFVDIVGIKSATYPSVTQTNTFSLISNQTPNLTPVNSIIVNCNLVRNDVSLSPNAFNSFSPNSSFGSNIYYEPSFATWIDCIPGNYNSIEIFLTDQNYNSIRANDPNILIEVIIKSKDETS